MLALSTLAVVICSVAVVFIPSSTSGQEVTSHANMSCTPYQTPCALGCCPFEDGVCCSDGFECCQHGQTCIPYVGICLDLVNGNEGGASLVSSKSTPVENVVSSCPPGYTECGKDRCCKYTHATCCSDGLHCCPHGYRCDVPKSRCIKNSYDRLMSIFSKMTAVPVEKVVKKSPYKSCPGSDKICPSYTSCCITDNGQWGCCPNTALGNLRAAGEDECCDTIFGYMCCSGDLPICTLGGCAQ